MSKKVFNWAIIGCGGISNQFCKGLKTLDNARVYAAASRDLGKARKLIDDFNGEKAFDDYEEMLRDDNIDAVYIGNIHNLHHRFSRMALEHGRPVLCEKPFTINKGEAEDLFALADKKKLFIMEAMWTRFLPGIQTLKKHLDEGLLGEIYTVRANFTIKVTGGPDHRLYNKETAGGALLDLSIYPITYAHLIFGGLPEKVQSGAVMGDTGVDEQDAILFDYGSGRQAVLTSSFRQAAPVEAIISGEKGYVRAQSFFCPQSYNKSIDWGEEETVETPFESTGLQYQAMELMKCVENGQMESEIHPRKNTLEIMGLMDNLRKEWGLKYKGE